MSGKGSLSPIHKLPQRLFTRRHLPRQCLVVQHASPRSWAKRTPGPPCSIRWQQRSLWAMSAAMNDLLGHPSSGVVSPSQSSAWLTVVTTVSLSAKQRERDSLPDWEGLHSACSKQARCTSARCTSVMVVRAGGSSLVLVHLFLLRPCKTHAPRVSSGRLPPRRASHPPPHRHTPSSGIAHTGPHRHAPTQAHTGVRAERIVACETGAARERREREAGTHGNSKLQRAPASRSRSPPQCSTRSRALHGPASTALCQAPRGGHARGRRGSTWVQGEVTSAVATRWCPPT